MYFLILKLTTALNTIAKGIQQIRYILQKSVSILSGKLVTTLIISIAVVTMGAVKIKESKYILTRVSM